MEDLSFLKESFGQMNGILTFITIVLIIVAFVVVKSKETIKEFFLKSKKPEPKSLEPLKHHSMFLTADRVINKINATDFTTFDSYDEIKTKLLKALIEMKVRVVKKRFLELIDRPGLKDEEPYKLKFIIATSLSSLVGEYNDMAIKYMSDNLEVSVKDAKFLVDKYEEFRQYIVDAFTDELEVIVMDTNYSDNFERLNTIFYAVSISLSIIPRDVVGVFNEINGRYKKYLNEKNT